MLAVGTGWVAFADREPPWDPEHGVQFAMMLCAKGGRVELDTAIHPNYAQACRFTYWRPLSEVVLSQVPCQHEVALDPATGLPSDRCRKCGFVFVTMKEADRVPVGRCPRCFPSFCWCGGDRG